MALSRDTFQAFSTNLVAAVATNNIEATTGGYISAGSRNMSRLRKRKSRVSSGSCSRQDKQMSLSSLSIESSTLTLQDLPFEILIHIIEWLDTTNHVNASIRAVSETSMTLNHISHVCMKRRWNISSSVTCEMNDGKTIMKDGIIQRLKVEDPKTATRLYHQYVLGGQDDDNNNNNWNQQLNDRYWSCLSGSDSEDAMFHGNTNMMHQWKRRMHGICRQLFTEHGWNSTRTGKESSIVTLLTHSWMRTIVFVVLIAVVSFEFGLFCRMTNKMLKNNTNCTTTISADSSAMRITIRLIVTLAITVTAITGTIFSHHGSFHNQQHNNQEWERHKLTQNLTKPIKRSCSQPELSHKTKQSIQLSYKDTKMRQQQNSNKLKRCQTFASPSLVSFNRHSCHANYQPEPYSDEGSSTSTTPGDNLNRTMELPVVQSFSSGSSDIMFYDCNNDSTEDEFGTFVYLEKEEDGDVIVKPAESLVTKFCCDIRPIHHRQEKVCMNIIRRSQISKPLPLQATVVMWTRMKPRGWVGLYDRAIRLAKKRIVHMVLDSRVNAHKKLNMIDRNELSASLMNACSNDDNAVSVIRSLSKSIPTQDFYIGIDGTESCALHTAAFNGAPQVIDFLCRGIDTAHKYKDTASIGLPLKSHGWAIKNDIIDADSDFFPYADGGLCDVNVTDMNGWTALHYAAGANSVDAVRVLVKHGASLHIPAVNGYTPLQWAIRLQHHNVANELRSIMTINQQEKHERNYWYQWYQKIHYSVFTTFILLLLLFTMIGIVCNISGSP